MVPINHPKVQVDVIPTNSCNCSCCWPFKGLAKEKKTEEKSPSQLSGQSETVETTTIKTTHVWHHHRDKDQ